MKLHNVNCDKLLLGRNMRAGVQIQMRTFSSGAFQNKIYNSLAFVLYSILIPSSFVLKTYVRIEWLSCLPAPFSIITDLRPRAPPSRKKKKTCLTLGSAPRRALPRLGSLSEDSTKTVCCFTFGITVYSIEQSRNFLAFEIRAWCRRHGNHERVPMVLYLPVLIINSKSRAIVECKWFLKSSVSSKQLTKTGFLHATSQQLHLIGKCSCRLNKSTVGVDDGNAVPKTARHPDLD